MKNKLSKILLIIYLNNSIVFGRNIDATCYNSINYVVNLNNNKTFRSVVISGNIFNDPNGGNVNNSSGMANTIPNNIFATLVNFNGTVIESLLVPTNGAFTFSPVVEDEYLVLISVNQGIINEPSPLAELPPNWLNTGEFNGIEDGGTDSQIDGTSELIQVDNDYSTINFACTN